MENCVTEILFELLRCALTGTAVSEELRKKFKSEHLPAIFDMAAAHDLSHLIAVAVINNKLLDSSAPGYQTLKKSWFMAVQRYELQNNTLKNLCAALESAEIEFIPLKGSVIRKLYPEPWMRTGCDIDVLVHSEDVDRAASYLKEKLGYEIGQQHTHDISLFAPCGVHIELHYNLIEEGRANNAQKILAGVWKQAKSKDGFKYHMELSYEMFYFYHIAHMAKHFENGGCGIRPFIDLWILDKACQDKKSISNLLKNGNLLQFAQSVNTLSEIWFNGKEYNPVSEQLSNFILCGGSFGTKSNNILIQQQKKGGKLKYILSRLFIPYDRLKLHYPILIKHRWLTPIMQIRRCFKFIIHGCSEVTKNDIKYSNNILTDEALAMKEFLKNIGL